jgi:hypothetical protein
MFDDKYNKIISLMEADPNMPPPADPNAGGGAPPPSPSDPGAGGGAPQEQPEKTPEEKLKEIENKSGKSWISLASTLAGVIQTPFTPEEVDQINAELPSGITLDDFSNYSQNIEQEQPNQMAPEKLTNMTSAAITMFDNVKKVLNKRNVAKTVTRAEDRE